MTFIKIIFLPDVVFVVFVLFAVLSYKVDVCCEHSHLSVTGFNFSEFGVVVNNNFDNTIFYIGIFRF